MNVLLTVTICLVICSPAVLFSAFAGGRQDPDTSEDGQSADPTPRVPTGVETVQSKDGTTIAYERQGKGPMLILVSGALSDRRSGSALAGMLAEHFTVINYDRRGRGDSGDTQPYAVEREVEDIAALIDEAGGNASLFGASSGAVLALEAAAKLPARVTGAVLFEPPFVVDDSRPPVPIDFVDAMKKLVEEDRRGDAVEYFMTKGVGLPVEVAAQMRGAPMWPMMESLAHTLPYDGAVMGSMLSGKPLPTDRWKGVTAPVLVAVGGASEPWLHNGSKALVAVMPSAEHCVLEGLDHGAPFVSPQSFVSLLREFLIDEGHR